MWLTMSELNDFTELHEAIEAELKARIPQLDTVALYDPTSIAPGQAFSINTPAVLIEMTEAKPGRALTGGRIPFNCEFALHCILSSKTSDLPLAVRNLGAMVSLVVGYTKEDSSGDPSEQMMISARQNWGLGSKGVESISVDSIAMYPGSFKPGKGGNEKAIGFDSMIVTFEQQIHLGNLLLNPPDFIAQSVEIKGTDNIGVDAWS
ncbi:hypothetical protein A6E09_17225 [Aliivibrio fischeri]|nr:hypothetical protein A6E09_17225 [Aliivibrio fischeri]